MSDEASVDTSKSELRAKDAEMARLTAVLASHGIEPCGCETDEAMTARLAERDALVREIVDSETERLRTEVHQLQASLAAYDDPELQARFAEIRAPRSPADNSANPQRGYDFQTWASCQGLTKDDAAWWTSQAGWGAALRSGETTPDYHSCTDPACKRCEKRPGEYCQDDDCNCGLPGNHATLTAETTPTPEEDQACMGAWRVVKLLENAKGIRRNVGIAEALDQARLNLAALAQRTGWRQPE